MIPAQQLRAHHQQKREQTQPQSGTIGPDIVPLVQGPENKEGGRFGPALNAAADDQHRAKLTQGSGEGQDHPVDKAPAQGREGDQPKGLPAAGP